MNITYTSKLPTTNLTYNDLQNGDVFLSFPPESEEWIPVTFMKCVDSTHDSPKPYLLDMETGELYEDVDMYPINKLLIDLSININSLDGGV